MSFQDIDKSDTQGIKIIQVTDTSRTSKYKQLSENCEKKSHCYYIQNANWLQEAGCIAVVTYQYSEVR